MDTDQETPEIQYVQVPKERLSEDALKGLIQEFILREGTDYGHAEPSLEEKYARVSKQLEKGQIVIVYSPLEDSCTLLLEREFKGLSTT